jgi:hypothetical protein
MGLLTMKETKAEAAATINKKTRAHQRLKHWTAEDIGPARAVEQIALHQSYREIGISAVAAAARYQGMAKNPAYAPVPTKLDYGSRYAIA